MPSKNCLVRQTQRGDREIGTIHFCGEEESISNSSHSVEESMEILKEKPVTLDEKLDDEAHFWLNGYVNKQNCRIWTEPNPQVYVETPLHPEKLTVWCALWVGGILLQKR
ncbi:hypothetical protein TNCV_3378901 [Trichonephila clavipes]|nr:hypothetical protein TNCV_3378901 [Trichonephila clavipes]